MIQDKELLLKDLSARLLYGIKFPMMCWDEETGETVKPVTLYSINKDGYCHVSEDNYSPHIDEIKPYLFPLSSMTEEQERELSKLGVSYGEYALHDDIRGLGIMVDEAYIFFEFCYKHHIDFLGLIEKDLAIDATGLNIY